MSIDGGLWAEISKHTTGVDWCRIESGLTGGGIPDLNGCRDGVEVWMELKQTSAWSVRIRPDQVGWAERRIRRGGRVFLLTRRHHDGGPRLGPAVDELWVHRGVDMRGVLRDGMREGPPPLMVCSGGPSSWDWDRVLRTLFEISSARS